jgi:hypothetical protein
MIFSNGLLRSYCRLLALYIFALASIWGFPYAEQIVGTITAVDTFLGIILGISTKKYKANGSSK